MANEIIPGIVVEFGIGRRECNLLLSALDLATRTFPYHM